MTMSASEGSRRIEALEKQVSELTATSKTLVAQVVSLATHIEQQVAFSKVTAAALLGQQMQVKELVEDVEYLYGHSGETSTPDELAEAIEEAHEAMRATKKGGVQ